MSTQKEEEFLQLVDEHAGILYKVSRIYAQSVADEEDLRQEVIYQAWRSFPSFKGNAKFFTWFYKVALNTALTHLRKEEKQKDLPQANSLNLEPKGDGRELLIAHIRNFSDSEKLIIMLHLDGYSNDEIARISGLKKNHVAVKLHRIKELLTQQLKSVKQ